MSKVVMAMVLVGAVVSFGALGCEEKKPDAKSATSTPAATATATAHATAAPAKPAGGGW